MRSQDEHVEIDAMSAGHDEVRPHPVAVASPLAPPEPPPEVRPHRRRPWITIAAASAAVVLLAASAALQVQKSSLSRELGVERQRVEALRSRLAGAEGRAGDAEARASRLAEEKAELERDVAGGEEEVRTLQGRVDACHAFLRMSARLYEANRASTSSEDARMTTNLVKCFGGSFPVFLAP